MEAGAGMLRPLLHCCEWEVVVGAAALGSRKVCAAGCAVQEGGQAVRKVRSGAATAEERARAAVLRCCRPLDSLAATSREAAGKLLGSATQHGTGCGVQFVKESGREPVGDGSWVRWSVARCGRRLRCCRIAVGQCGSGLWAAHREAALPCYLPPRISAGTYRLLP